MSHSADLARANQLIVAGHHRPALDLLQSAIGHRPDDPMVLCLVARACLGLGLNRSALESASHAVTVAPDDDLPLRLVARANSRMGRSSEAIAAARQAIAVAPDNWLTHHELAVVRWTTNRLTDEALESAEQAVRLAPDEPEAYRLAGFVNAALGHDRAAQACFRRTLALDPHDAVARHELARVDFKRGRNFAAADGFSNAVALDPRLQVGVDNLDLIVGRFVRLCYWLVCAAAVAEPLLAQRLIVLTVVSVLLAAIAGYCWMRTRHRIGRYLAGLIRQPGRLLQMAGLTGLALLLLWLDVLIRDPSHRLMIVAAIVLVVARSTRSLWLEERMASRRRSQD